MPFTLSQKCPGVKGRDEGNPFHSVDPAPALAAAEAAESDGKQKETYTVEEMKQRLLDTSLSLYERYRAMFGLRNKNTEESVLALTAGLHDESALFRHEVAYVLGQLAHPAATDALEQVRSPSSCLHSTMFHLAFFSPTRCSQ